MRWLGREKSSKIVTKRTGVGWRIVRDEIETGRKVVLLREFQDFVAGANLGELQ